MVYAFAWDLKGRHLALFLDEMMEVMVEYKGYSLSKTEENHGLKINLAKFGCSKPDFSGFSQ